MSIIVHCRVIDGATLFRAWSTVTDQYVTAPLSKDELREWLIGYNLHNLYSQVTNILDKAEMFGTSGRSYDGIVPLDWARERCQYCNGFHHQYSGINESRCRWCGEEKTYIYHHDPCTTNKK